MDLRFGELVFARRTNLLLSCSRIFLMNLIVVLVRFHGLYLFQLVFSALHLI